MNQITIFIVLGILTGSIYMKNLKTEANAEEFSYVLKKNRT